MSVLLFIFFEMYFFGRCRGRNDSLVCRSFFNGKKKIFFKKHGVQIVFHRARAQSRNRTIELPGLDWIWYSGNEYPIRNGSEQCSKAQNMFRAYKNRNIY